MLLNVVREEAVSLETMTSIKNGCDPDKTFMQLHYLKVKHKNWP